jgi:hypothetical protein
MAMMEIPVRRTSVVSSRPFEEVVARLTATIGRPDMNAFHAAIAGPAEGAKRTRSEQPPPRGGESAHHEGDGQGCPDAAAYAPITILVDERADGVHLSYDSM